MTAPKRLTDLLEESGDFVRLQNDADYAHYFAHLLKVCSLIQKWYGDLLTGGDEEARVVNEFLKKFLKTVNTLQLLTSFDEKPELRLDLNSSGFPHSFALRELAALLLEKQAGLQAAKPAVFLREQMLDYMFLQKSQPRVLLKEMSLRHIMESVDATDLFLPFTLGSIRPEYVEPGAKTRRYTISWGCYDPEQNLPNIHVMLFEQDVKSEPLEKQGSAWNAFIRVISTEGARVPQLLILAHAIDEALDDIHPKLLKRITVGPVVSPSYSKEQSKLKELIGVHSGDDDIAIILCTEIIRSMRQEKRNSLFGGRVREIFAIPRQDAECLERGVSALADYVIVPHRVYQHLPHGKLEGFAREPQIITYNRKGGLLTHV